MSKTLKSSCNFNQNITMSTFEIICDRSKEKLTEIPKETLTKTNLKMLFLEGNEIASLPSDFFIRLPQLTWLDLRNNKLTSIPRNIKDHTCLECLFLTNNLLQKLPNEIGMVRTLKAIQVANNPLIYPPKNIISQGTQDILNYLRQNYDGNEISDLLDTQNFTETTAQNSNESTNALKSDTKSFTEPTSTEHQVDTSTMDSLKMQSKDSQNNLRQQMCNLLLSNAIKKINPVALSKSMSRTQSSVKESSGQSISSSLLSSKKSHEALKKKITADKQFPIQVKSLTKCNGRKKVDTESISEKIVHKIYRQPDSISIKSYFNKINDKLERGSKIVDPAIKEAWMNNLRVLLADQERILQQERNLRTLTKWRKDKKQNMKEYNPNQNIINPPFGISEEFFKMMTREELQMQLENYLRQRCSPMASNQGAKGNSDVDNAINELMKQLKIIDNRKEEHPEQSPRTEIKLADKQIQLIMDIQKKLLLLKRNFMYK